MSPLRYVLCVLLVVTVTTATTSQTSLDELKNARTLMDMTIAMATERVNDTIIATKEYVNTVLSQVLLLTPLDLTYFDGEEEVKYSEAPSAECYEFLKNRIETNEAAVHECVDPLGLVMMGHSISAAQNLDRTLLHFHEHKRFAANCKYWNDDLTEVLMCERAVLKDITEVSYRASERSSKLMDAVIEIGNSWIAQTGACVARKEGGSAMEDWSKACEK